jgi:multidrug efflux system outer membrane protein
METAGEPASSTGVVIGIPEPPGRAGPVPRTVEECVEEALENNVALRSLRLRGKEIAGLGWEAVSTGLPSLDVVGNWTRSRDPSFLLDESFSGGGGEIDTLFPGFDFSFLPDPEDIEAQSFWRGNLSSDWELNPFRVINAIQGVGITRAQLDEDVRAEEQRVVEETIRTYHRTVLHQEVRSAVEAEIAARSEFLAITRRRLALGLATELDTLQAAVSVANLRPAARRADKNLRNAASSLNLLMGRDVMAPIALQTDRTIETDRIDPAAAIGQAESRPDLRSGELGIRLLEKRRGVERADRRPFLSANGSYGYVARSADDLMDRRSADDLMDREFDRWDASVSLIFPLFDGFYTKGRVQQVDVQIERAHRDLEDARRQARLEVATTLAEVEAARENYEAARLNLAAAGRALEQMTLRFDLGKAEYLSVLNAESERFAARSQWIEARFDVLVQTAALKRAMGFHPLLPLSEIREELEGSAP